MKKILAFLLVMLLLTGLLTACGGGTNTPTEPEAEETVDPEYSAEGEEDEEWYTPEPLLAIDPRLVGIWIWDGHNAYEYNFFEDGTGTRGAEVLDEITEFTWSITEEFYLVIETDYRTERWDYDLDLDTLTLTSRQDPNAQHSYTRLGRTTR